MAHFAHITNGIVDQVIVIEPAVLEGAGGWPIGGIFRPIHEWKQTSYNTVKGEHKLGGIPLRKNYAGIGYSYDVARDAFIPPKRFPSFVLDEKECVYKPPKERPLDGKNYEWSEDLLDWVVIKSK